MILVEVITQEVEKPKSYFLLFRKFFKNKISQLEGRGIGAVIKIIVEDTDVFHFPCICLEL